MNFRKSLLLFCSAAAIFTSCKQTESEAPETSEKVETAAAKPQTASFTIEGMSCAVGCAKTIEKKLAKMEGVTKVEVDFEKKMATVNFDAAKLSPETLVEAVESAADGKTYKVSDMKASGDQAMNFDQEKEKEKKKKSEKKTSASKKSGENEKSGEKKAGCCASKKACHA